MKALYRKYRPTTLAEVIGQDQVKKPLEEAIKSGKISHAYLFTGPRGCGKTSVARIFAHVINHFPYEIEDSYVDIIEIDAASNTGVDNIRELREKAMIAPTKGQYKVYIIDEIHMLSKSAFNALLKTLEEPPKNVVFIMATTDLRKVPDTITSRAQVYNFNLASAEIMQKHLSSIAKKEKIKITDDALALIVSKGGGSFRDSISLLDQISTLSQDKITRETVLFALGLPDDDTISDLLTSYQDGNLTKITDLLHTQLNSGKKPEILAENLIKAIIAQPKPKLLPLLERLTDVRAPFPEAKLILAFLAEATEKPVLRVAAPNSTPTTPTTPIAQKAPRSATAAPKSSETTPRAPEKSPQPTNFDRATYIAQVKSKNSALAHILEKCIIEQNKDVILIYVDGGSFRRIIDSDKNHQVLQAMLPPNLSLEIHDASEHAVKNQNLSKISDIMGGVTEVNTDGVPFE